MRGRWADRLVLAGVAVVVVIAALDTAREHGHPKASPTRALASAPVPAAAVPARVALRGSPETAFLPECAPERLRLLIASGPRLVLRYRGGRCHLASLGLRAIVRDDSGTLVYRGAAVEPGALAGNLAGAAVLTAPLMPRVLRCRASTPLNVHVAGRLAASGTVRCRGEF